MALPQPASTIKGVALKHPKLHNILGVSRSSLYYRRKKPVEDWQIKQKIEIVLHDFPSYGHKRIAIALKLNNNICLILCNKKKKKTTTKKKKKIKKKKKKKKLWFFPESPTLYSAGV